MSNIIVFKSAVTLLILTVQHYQKMNFANKIIDILIRQNDYKRFGQWSMKRFYAFTRQLITNKWQFHCLAIRNKKWNRYDIKQFKCNWSLFVCSFCRCQFIYFLVLMKIFYTSILKEVSLSCVSRCIIECYWLKIFS